MIFRRRSTQHRMMGQGTGIWIPLLMGMMNREERMIRIARKTSLSEL